MAHHRPIARGVSSLPSEAREEAHAAGAKRLPGIRRAVEAASGRAARRCAKGADPGQLRSDEKCSARAAATAPGRSIGVRCPAPGIVTKRAPEIASAMD